MCSENTSVWVDARDNSFNISVVKNAAGSGSVSFRLSGISLLSIACQCQQSSSNHTFHLRLKLKEIIPEDENCMSADDCATDTQAMLTEESFYCHCRQCGVIVLSRLL